MKRFLLDDDIFEMILDGIPSPIFIVDNDVRIYSYNKAASALFGNEPGNVKKWVVEMPYTVFTLPMTQRGVAGLMHAKNVSLEIQSIGSFMEKKFNE